MAVNYMGGANVQLSRIRRQQEGVDARFKRVAGHTHPQGTTALRSKLSNQAGSVDIPTSIVTQRLDAFIQQRRGALEQGPEHQPRIDLSSHGMGSAQFRAECGSDMHSLAEGKKRSVEQIDEFIEDLLGPKRRLLRSLYYRPREVSVQAKPPPVPMQLQREPELVEDAASPLPGRRRLAHPVVEKECSPIATIAQCPKKIDVGKSLHHEVESTHSDHSHTETFERGNIDTSRFERSIKGLFTSLRHAAEVPERIKEQPISTRQEESTAKSANCIPTPESVTCRSKSGSLSPSSTPPRAYTPLALPLRDAAALLTREPQLDEEVRRLEVELSQVRRVLSRQVEDAWPTEQATGCSTQAGG